MKTINQSHSMHLLPFALTWLAYGLAFAALSAILTDKVIARIMDCLPVLMGIMALLLVVGLLLGY